MSSDPLTRADVLTMPAGRDLDRLVAEHVLRLIESFPDLWSGSPPPGEDALPLWTGPEGARPRTPHRDARLSTSGDGMLLVLARLRAQFTEFHLGQYPRFCEVIMADNLAKHATVIVEADTLPLAVGRAAVLAALGL